MTILSKVSDSDEWNTLCLSHFINGELTREGASYTHHSPWDQKPFSTIPIADAGVVDRAVRSARAALDDWRTTPIADRARYLTAMADWLVERYGEEGAPTDLKRLISREVGKPLPEADIEVIESSDFLRFFADNAEAALAVQTPKLDQQLWASKRADVWYEPHGVVAIIKPWNYPLEMIAWALGPALAAGNTVVVKPSEKSSAVAAAFAEMAIDIGLPPGVINIVLGPGSTGAALVAHEGTNFVSFTGSAVAGKQVAISCAEQLKPTALELSGNDAAIVLNDADLELTSNGLVWGAFCNAGQVCVGIKRAFVEADVYDELVELVVKKAAALRLGIDIGPIIDKNQVNHVRRFLTTAAADGSCVRSGGRIQDFDGGTYVEPTVLLDVPPTSPLLADECFGPLLPIWKVLGESEAVERTNDSKYGLGASIWTRSQARATDIARRLSVGMIWVNDVNIALPQAPWGGRKSSGFGYELTVDSIRHYSRPKHFNTELSSECRRAWWYPY